MKYWLIYTTNFNFSNEAALYKMIDEDDNFDIFSAFSEDYVDEHPSAICIANTKEDAIVEFKLYFNEQLSKYNITDDKIYIEQITKKDYNQYKDPWDNRSFIEI